MQFLHGKQAIATGKCSNAETSSPWQLGSRGWMGRSEERKAQEKGGANINKRMAVAAETPATTIHRQQQPGNWVSVGAVQWPFGCQ